LRDRPRRLLLVSVGTIFRTDTLVKPKLATRKSWRKQELHRMSRAVKPPTRGGLTFCTQQETPPRKTLQTGSKPTKISPERSSDQGEQTHRGRTGKTKTSTWKTQGGVGVIWDRRATNTTILFCSKGANNWGPLWRTTHSSSITCTSTTTTTISSTSTSITMQKVKNTTTTQYLRIVSPFNACPINYNDPPIYRDGGR
jgi:hypothetical protein